LQFKILGPLEVHEDGRVVPVRAGKLAALLAVLLLRRNEVVASDRLVEELWNGDAPATAAKTLQLYVSQLRRLLPAETLVTRAPGYILRVEPGELDAERFEELLASGREALETGEPKRAAETLRRALALWRGPPLADFTYDEFARREIERLEELRLEALEERIEADLARGRHTQVVGELEALTREHPLRERLCAQLMLALYRCGRQADALAVYREARRRLDAELGIEPGPQLRELEAAILRQDESIAAPGRPRGIPGRRRWTRRRKLVVVAVVVAAAAAAALAAALDRASPTRLVPPNSVAIVDPRTGKLVGHVAAGAQGELGEFVGTVSLDRRIAVSGGSVWVANRNDRTISRIDPKTLGVRTVVGIDGAIEDVAVAANGDPWATLGLGGLDHVAHGSVDHVTPPNAGGPTPGFSGLAAGADALWIGRSDQGELSLVKFDPSTETIVGSVRIGTAGAHSVAVGGGFVWVSDSADSTVTRIDATSLRRRRRLRIADPGSVAVGGGKVWITSQIGNRLWYDDTKLEQPLDTTFVGSAPVSVAYGAGAVWVANYGDGTVSKVDPNTQRVEKTTKVGRHVSSVAAGAGRVWVVVAPGS
jgi:DNA-binding SARP family transcriptional activator/DNA-binding beta-propeller fold protein YncE